jgi:hypothetical protein
MPDTDIGYDDYTGLGWLDDSKVNAAWYQALAAIDRRGNKRPLISLLRSGEVPPPSISFYIADLLDRYALKPRKARPRTPGYLRTPEQIKLIAAVIEVHKRVHRDSVLLPLALRDVAAESGLSEETLTAAYLGQHGGLRRAMRNWYRPKVPRTSGL